MCEETAVTARERRTQVLQTDPAGDAAVVVGEERPSSIRLHIDYKASPPRIIPIASVKERLD